MTPLGHGDEAMLRDRLHPAHTSGTREGMWAALIVLIVSVVLWSFFPVDWISRYFKILISLLFAVPAFLVVSRWIGGARERSRARHQAEYRAEQERLKQVQLDAMAKDGPNRE